MKTKTYGLSGKRKKSSLRWLYLPFMLLLALGACAWATQQVAILYAYHAALGQPWFVLDGMPLYAPWSIFIWAQKFPTHYLYIEKYITYGQGIFLAPQFLLLGYWLMRRRLSKGNDELHGSARWADEEDIQNMGYLGGAGIYIGGWVKKASSLLKLWHLLRARPLDMHYYLRYNGDAHLMIFAPTRSGKGVSLILPTLLAWTASTIVLDIKGENHALTGGYLKSLGNTVLRFDLSDASGTGARINLLDEMRIDTLYGVQDVQRLARMLVDTDGKGLHDHWTKAAFAFFAGAILHCCIMTKKIQGRTATLTDLVLMLADESRTSQELLEEMVEADHATILHELFKNPQGTAEAHTFIASSAREMLNKDEKEASGVLSSAVVNLAVYRDPIVALNLSRSDFRLNDLMNHEKPVNLYLVIPPGDIDRLLPFLRLLIDMIVRRVTMKMEFADGRSVAGYKHKLLFMFDEFTALGKIPIIEKAIAYIAGYGGKFFLIVQDLKQLNAVYGKDNALMGNCHIRIAYAPNDIDTAKLLSEMTGKTTVIETKTSLSGSSIGAMKSASMNTAETARPLLTPDECTRLPGIRQDKKGKTLPGEMLIFTAGQPAIYGRQILYFQDPVFSKRAKYPAPQVSDSLYFINNQALGQNIEIPNAIAVGQSMTVFDSIIDTLSETEIDSGEKSYASYFSDAL